MTYEELRVELNDLFFGTHPEYQTMYVTATNIAVAQMNRLCPPSARITIKQVGKDGSLETYFLPNLAEDFSVSYLLPVDDKGEQIEGAFYGADKMSLFVPSSYDGTMEVEYQRKPKKARLEHFTEGNIAEKEQVDIPSDLEDVLSVLVASIVCLDDEPSLAQYYKALYNEQARDVRFWRKKNLHGKVINRKGWR